MTSISDIIYEDAQDNEENNDRHVTKPTPRRIRQDDGSYIEDENLFDGEIVENREKPQKVDKKTVDVNGIKAKADELAKLRELDDKEMGHPSRRPIGGRRP